MGIFIAFVPWILFGTISQHDSIAAAGLVSLAAAIVIGLPSFAARRPKILDLGAIAVFALLTVAGLALGADADWLEQYAQAISSALLAAIALGSLLWVPFTEQYARESVPEEHWSSPVFKRVNRELTLMWGLVFVALVPCQAIAGAIGTGRGHTLFTWAIPIALIVWAVKRTARVSDAAGGDAPAAAERSTSIPVDADRRSFA